MLPIITETTFIIIPSHAKHSSVYATRRAVTNLRATHYCGEEQEEVDVHQCTPLAFSKKPTIASSSSTPSSYEKIEKKVKLNTRNSSSKFRNSNKLQSAENDTRESTLKNGDIPICFSLLSSSSATASL